VGGEGKKTQQVGKDGPRVSRLFQSVGKKVFALRRSREDGRGRRSTRCGQEPAGALKEVGRMKGRTKFESIRETKGGCAKKVLGDKRMPRRRPSGGSLGGPRRYKCNWGQINCARKKTKRVQTGVQTRGAQTKRGAGTTVELNTSSQIGGKIVTQTGKT